MKWRYLPVLIFAMVAMAGINYGPYLTCPSTGGATVQFGKDLWDSATIEWADSAAYVASGSFDHSADISAIDMRSSYDISGFAAGTRVYYQVSAGSETSPVYSFRTTPLPGSPIHFCIYGDCRTNEAVHTVVCERMVETNPTFVIQTGDLGDAAWSVDDWDAYFNAADTLSTRVPYVSTIGNHEIPTDIYKYLFDLPGNEEWYAIHAGCVSILNINLYTSYLVGSEQYNWIVATLSDSIPPETRWVIVNEHESPYSTSNHGSNMTVREVLKPIYDSLGVDVVAAGHDHCYEHSYVDGIHYFVAGGGGAPLYSVSGGPFTVHCVSSYNYIEVHADSSDMCFWARSDEDALIERFCLSDFPVGIAERLQPHGFSLKAFPNPFNTTTKIALVFGFDVKKLPKIEIFDVSGKRVRTFRKPNRDGVSGRLTKYSVFWDGRDDSGGVLPAGCYFVKSSDNANIATTKVVLLK